MIRTVIVYAVILAAAVFALEWLEYHKLVRSLRPEAYAIVLAIAFAGLGVWVGIYVSRRRRAGGFEKNVAVLEELGITEREYRVLELLAEGSANKEIARQLGISPNTVKTHIANLYDKIGVQRRTQAVQTARSLGLLP